MPITYLIDKNSGMFLSKWSGDIVASDLEKYWMDLAGDPDVAKARLHLVDVREANFAFTSAELWRKVDEHYRGVVGGRPIMVALLAANEQQELVIKKWSSLLPATEVTMLFHDHAQALEWLTGFPKTE